MLFFLPGMLLQAIPNMKFVSCSSVYSDPGEDDSYTKKHICTGWQRLEGLLGEGRSVNINTSVWLRLDTATTYSHNFFFFFFFFFFFCLIADLMERARR